MGSATTAAAQSALLLLLLAASAGRGAGDAAPAAHRRDYCSLCDPPGTHTMCLFPLPGPAANCSGYRPARLSAREQRAIVRTHNIVRSRVALGQSWARLSNFGPQPQAADMRQLYWDDELAALAQRWGDRCLSFYTEGPHDVCRDTFRFPVGQNIVSTAYSKPVESDVRARTLDWYSELAFFDPAWVQKFAPNPDPDPAKQIGHYTQMVWGWTYAIGCARVVFEEQFQGEAKPWIVERLVCNYAPSGNYMGQPVYTVGPPCSQCPEGTSCSTRFPGLCEINNSTSEDAALASANARSASTRTNADGGGVPSEARRPDDFYRLPWWSDGDNDDNDVSGDSETTTEHGQDEEAVVGGAEALENGTRLTETFKPVLETERPAAARDSGGGSGAAEAEASLATADEEDGSPSLSEDDSVATSAALSDDDFVSVSSSQEAVETEEWESGSSQTESSASSSMPRPPGTSFEWAQGSDSRDARPPSPLPISATIEWGSDSVLPNDFYSYYISYSSDETSL